MAAAAQWIKSRQYMEALGKGIRQRNSQERLPLHLYLAATLTLKISEILH